MIKTIIFDLAEVYLKGTVGIERFLEPILKVNPEDIRPALKGDNFVSLMNAEITEEEYWSNIIKKTKWNIDINSLKEAIRKNFQEIKGTREIIEKLKSKGYKLGLLSVHAKEWIEYCNKKFDYHKLFDSVLYSYEVAMLKPDKKFYELILNKLKAEPSECIFIDNQERYLVPAKELGIHTICFKSAEQLKKELASFSINLD